MTTQNDQRDAGWLGFLPPRARWGRNFKVAGGLLGISLLAGFVTAVGLLPAVAVGGISIKHAVAGFDKLPAGILDPNLQQASTVLAADGTPIASIFFQNRVSVPITKISPNMQHAIVAIEDSRFYEHHGIDLRGTFRAALSNVLGGNTQGGSTITQQYVKNMLINSATTPQQLAAAHAETLSRKIRELRLAMSVENRYSKNQILERYLNIAFFGSKSYGIEAASRRYFSKPSADLNVAEAATLAGIVQSPVQYDPILNPKSSQHRRGVVLRRMHDLGYISTWTMKKAAAIPTASLLNTSPSTNGCTTSLAPFFCDYVLAQLRTDPTFGGTPTEREDLLRSGGLTIQTTLDVAAQTAANSTVRKYIPEKDPSRKAAALTMIQPGTGNILAMAQNRQWGTYGIGKTAVNYNVGRDYNGIIGLQAGSTFKAFIIAAALKQRISPYEVINSPKVATFSGFTDCNGGTFAPYTVHNSSPRENGGYTMFAGAADSVNTYFMALEKRVGLCNAVQVATDLGVRGGNGEPPIQVPSFTLGTPLVTPMSMANAYATFAAHGSYCPPRAITSVTNRDGIRYLVPPPQCTQALDRATADGVTKVLRGVIDGPFPGRTGAGLTPGREAAGKTGTIDDNAAVWFVGYTPEAATAVWCGDPRGGQRHPMRNLTINGKHYSQIYGATLPGPIWRDTMKGTLAKRPKSYFQLQTFVGSYLKHSTPLWPDPSIWATTSPSATTSATSTPSPSGQGSSTASVTP